MTDYIAPIDRHVELAFDMLQHVYGFLHAHHPLEQAELDQVLAKLFPVVEQCLKLAAPARVPLLEGVLEALPDRQRVADRLAGVRVHEERKKALQELAEREVGESVARLGEIATFRECANNWRGVLPHPYHVDGAHPILWQSDREALLATSLYWSGPLADRHTRLGPSYRLSHAALLLAREAVARGIDASRARPCSELRQAIKAMPDWCAEFDPAKRTERLERASGVLSDALLLADELELQALCTTNQAPPSGAAPLQAGQTPTQEKVFRAIMLAKKDIPDMKSMRHYARMVGVDHSTLSRNPEWRRWYAGCVQASSRGSPAKGFRSSDGQVEAEDD